MNYIVKEFLETKGIKNFQGRITSGWTDKSPQFISPLYGSAKSFLINGLSTKEKQIVILLPDSKSVDEFNVELSVLDLSDHLLIVNEFRSEPLQEVLTEITKREKFILLTTYNILNCELPPKEKISEQTNATPPERPSILSRKLNALVIPVIHRTVIR